MTDLATQDRIPTKASRPGSLGVPRSDTPRGSAELKVLHARILMLAGEWDRALSQLEDAASLEVRASRLARTYRDLIRGERARASVFAGHSTPGVVGGMQPWLAQLATCLSLDRQGNTAWASELRLDTFEVAPEAVASVNGSVLTSIADADARLGPVLELIVGGSYYWAPFACIQRITIQRLRHARNLVWLPAQITWRTGEQSMAFIPARYPGSEHSDDEDIRLGHKTHWRTIGEECYAGLGQRRLKCGANEIAIMDIREVSFATGA